MAGSPQAQFDALVSGLDYPMYVVTAASAVRRAGCLVGFVTQASIDPPRLVVMLSKANFTYRVAQQTDELVVHVLHVGNRDLAALFGEETGDERDKLAGRTDEQTPAGTPILAGTLGWIAGTVLDRLDCGDHTAHLLDVREARVDGRGEPLSFQAVKDLDPGHPA